MLTKPSPIWNGVFKVLHFAFRYWSLFKLPSNWSRNYCFCSNFSQNKTAWLFFSQNPSVLVILLLPSQFKETQIFQKNASRNLQKSYRGLIIFPVLISISEGTLIFTHSSILHLDWAFHLGVYWSLEKESRLHQTQNVLVQKNPFTFIKESK